MLGILEFVMHLVRLYVPRSISIVVPIHCFMPELARIMAEVPELRFVPALVNKLFAKTESLKR
jgi:hypothetical protein